MSFQSKAHLPLASRKSNIIWPWSNFGLMMTLTQFITLTLLIARIRKTKSNWCTGSKIITFPLYDLDPMTLALKFHIDMVNINSFKGYGPNRQTPRKHYLPAYTNIFTNIWTFSFWVVSQDDQIFWFQIFVETFTYWGWHTYSEMFA